MKDKDMDKDMSKDIDMSKDMEELIAVGGSMALAALNYLQKPTMATCADVNNSVTAWAKAVKKLKPRESGYYWIRILGEMFEGAAIAEWHSGGKRWSWTGDDSPRQDDESIVVLPEKLQPPQV